MTLHKLTAEDLLAGANTSFELAIPAEVLNPSFSSEKKMGLSSNGSTQESTMIVELRPLSIGAFQLIMKASRNDAGMIPLLMIKEAMLTPKMSIDQIRKLNVGLVEFIVKNIRTISGLSQKKSP